MFAFMGPMTWGQKARGPFTDRKSCEDDCLRTVTEHYFGFKMGSQFLDIQKDVYWIVLIEVGFSSRPAANSPKLSRSRMRGVQGTESDNASILGMQTTNQGWGFFLPSTLLPLRHYSKLFQFFNERLPRTRGRFSCSIIFREIARDIWRSQFYYVDTL